MLGINLWYLTKCDDSNAFIKSFCQWNIQKASAISKRSAVSHIFILPHYSKKPYGFIVYSCAFKLIIEWPQIDNFQCRKQKLENENFIEARKECFSHDFLRIWYTYTTKQGTPHTYENHGRIKITTFTPRLMLNWILIDISNERWFLIDDAWLPMCRYSSTWVTRTARLLECMIVLPFYPIVTLCMINIFFYKPSIWQIFWKCRPLSVRSGEFQSRGWYCKCWGDFCLRKWFMRHESRFASSFLMYFQRLPKST